MPVSSAWQWYCRTPSVWPMTPAIHTILTQGNLAVVEEPLEREALARAIAALQRMLSQHTTEG
jgi:hypothetical protein